MKHLLTALARYRDYWKEDTLRAGFWTGVILIIVVYGLSEGMI